MDIFRIAQIIMLALLGLCCLAGIVLQFYAWRHLKPGIPRYGHKDALFKKKEEYYEPEGLRYIEMQKKIMYGMAGIFALFIVMLELEADGPPT